MTSCEDCLRAQKAPDSYRRYSTGCIWCGARYLRDGGEHPDDWMKYGGISLKAIQELRMQGEFYEPKGGKR